MRSIDAVFKISMVQFNKAFSKTAIELYYSEFKGEEKMYKIDTTALGDLARFSYSIKFGGKIPTEETVKVIINKFQPISNLNFENYNFDKLEKDFKFSYFEFSREDDPYRHKALGVAIIASSSSNYSNQLVHALLNFVVDSMKDLDYAKVLEIILKPIFPNFKTDISKITGEFIKNY